MWSLLTLLACSDDFDDSGPKPVDTADADTGDADHTGGTDDTGPDDTGEGGPKDRDGDGYTEDVDCVDVDATVYPGAEEVWYDGIDQDCAGDSDYDQDHDGYLADHIGGDDCDDTDATIHPGAVEAWYDGIDGDCAGGDDYDQDGDGDPIEAAGGLDCDDTDATVSSLQMEVLDDGVDGDCDGGLDTFWLHPLDTTGAAGLQGPRITADSTTAMVSFLADTYTDPVTGRPATTGSFTYHYDEADPWAGLGGTSTWEWGVGYTFSTGFDFWATDDHYVWAHGLHTATTRYLFADVYDTATGDFSGSGLTYPTTHPFLDVELTEATDGSLHLVGCDVRLGYLSWIHGSPTEFLSGSGLAYDDLANVEADNCVADVPERVVLAGNSAEVGVQTFAYADATGLATDAVVTELTPVEVQSYQTGTVSARVVAAGADGVYVDEGGDVAWLRAQPAESVRGSLAASGQMALVYTGGAGAVLAWGDTTSGFLEVELPTGLPHPDDADVFLSTGGQLLVVVRSGDDAVLGVVGI